jgi:hypothetical protein
MPHAPRGPRERGQREEARAAKEEIRMAFGDPYRALITEDRYFHLGPLKRAYRESCGSGAPGSTTIVIHLENHSQGGPPAQRSLEYSF